MIPAIPGFAGDLRDDAATGTRAIMDYQYKSICRGEHSIFGQIKKEGVDPTRESRWSPFLPCSFLTPETEHIFVFNLRAYDRLNKTPALIEQEKKSGVRYQDLQRAEAEEIMGSALHGTQSERQDSDAQLGQSATNENHEKREEMTDYKRRFEEARGEIKVDDPVTSADSIAEDAMMNGGTVSEEPWEGEPEDEKDNFVQEELYIHAKLLIVDDKTVICGSSNLNDRVSRASCPVPTLPSQLTRRSHKVATRVPRLGTFHRHGGHQHP